MARKPSPPQARPKRRPSPTRSRLRNRSHVQIGSAAVVRICRRRTHGPGRPRLPDRPRRRLQCSRVFADGSRLAFLAIKDCEKELDQIERKIDDQLPEAITRVGEAKARELLACLKFITDLERIGDLAYSAVMQLQPRREKLPPPTPPVDRDGFFAL